jgi:CheY-like chemotaxis protein
VDDESPIAALITEVLRTQGAKVSLKTSATEALAQLRQIEENSTEEKGTEKKVLKKRVRKKASNMTSLI